MSTRAGRPEGSRSGQLLEAVAGLLSAGVLVVGLGLAVLTVAAPALIHGSGFSAASGPRPDRVVVQVAVGAVGELLHWRRARLPPVLRPATAVVIIAAVLAALWWGWWR